MSQSKIKALIMDLYINGVGAQLLNAVDMREWQKVGGILRSRKTLTTQILFGKEEDKNVEIYVESLTEEGRNAVLCIRMTQAMYEDHFFDLEEDDSETLESLAEMLSNHYVEVGLYWDSEEKEEDLEWKTSSGHTLSLVKEDEQEEKVEEEILNKEVN